MSVEIPIVDPYQARPSFLQRRGEAVTVIVVFLLTVLLAVLSFPPFHLPSLAYAMLVPGIFWAYLQPRLKIYAWTMFAAQAVAWTVILAWLHHVTWPGLFLLGPLVGAWIGAWYLAAWWLMPRMVGRPVLPRLLAMLGLAGVWVLVEWTRTWLLSGFPWLPLAASQWERSSILQIAAYTGAYGVSFVLVAVNIGFAAYAHRLFRERDKTGLRKRSQEFFLAVFLLLLCLNVHVQETFKRMRFTAPLGRVAMVQPYIPQAVKWDPEKAGGILEVLEKTTLAAAPSKPDLILWPEATTPFAVRGDANTKAFIESLSVRANAPMLVGSIAIEESGQAGERWLNGAFLVTPGAGLHSDYYAKRHLVPFGEYVPLRPLLGWLSKFVPIGSGDFQRGSNAAPLLVTLHGTPVVVGALICYEDIYPQLARASALAGAEVLCVVTNNAWYGEGGAAYQHAAHSVLRAVETRRPVLRCGNGGWSGWIDEFGTVRKVLLNKEGSIYFRGTETLTVTRDSRWVGRSSFYVEHGNWFVGLCAVLALLAFANIRLTPQIDDRS
ncbi:MAG TPA: apolipoprotein N-acyltransferase [Opitutaceae bacterium]|nr:apolipoprotein N-acyltransferase [Opitutaceae bacterium]